MAGVSFGAKRTFRVSSKKDMTVMIAGESVDISKGRTAFDLEWPSGALVVMDGEFQNEFKHSVPVMKKVKDPRVSLTFRTHSE